MFSQPQRVSLLSVLREKEFWLLFLLGTLYYHRPLFLSETFFFRELWTIHIPQKFLLADFIKMWELPLWDRYMHGGIPVLANLGSHVLYPTNILYFILPPLRAFNVICVIHLIASSLSAYCCARILGLRPLSSVMTGLIYGYCGYTLSYLSLFASFMAIPYLPLLCLFWHLYCLEGKRRWFLITVLLGAYRVLSGAPEAQITGMLFLLGWSIVYPYPHKKRFRMIVAWGFLGFFCIGLVAIQIVPTIEMMSFSSRGQIKNYTEFTQWSIFPARLLELVFPKFLGDYTKIDRFSFWGENIIDARFPYVANIYLGLITIVLAIFASIFRDREQRNTLPQSIRYFLGILVLFSFLLSLGRFLPLFHLVYAYVPFISFFRYPVKFMQIGLWPLALLAGYGAEMLFGKGQAYHSHRPSKECLWKFPRRLLIAVWSVFILMLVFLVSFRMSEEVAGGVLTRVFDRSFNGVVHDNVFRSLLHSVAIWGIFALVSLSRFVKKTRWQLAILVGIVAVDLLTAGRFINPTASEDFLTKTPPIVEHIRNDIGEGRLFRTDTLNTVSIRHNKVLGSTPTYDPWRAPTNDIIWAHRKELEYLEGHMGVFYKFPMIFHQGMSLANKRFQRLKDILYTLPWERRIPLLSAGRVSVILTEEKLSLPGIEKVTEVRSFDSSPLYLYRNVSAAKHVEFVNNWGFATSDEEALQMMLRPGYDPRNEVVLQEPEISEYKELPAGKSERGQVCHGAVKITRLQANTHSAKYSISTPCDGFMVFSDPFYPGWEIFVDDAKVSILQANFAFSAVFLQAGEHTVKRVYRPKSLRIGGVVSLISCLLLGLILHKGRNFITTDTP